MELQSLLEGVRDSHARVLSSELCSWLPGSSSLGDLHYAHQEARLGIDFQVERLPFEALQVMDPRVVTIAPGACNEKHRHAHESIFVVLSGHGEILIGQTTESLQTGQVAYVPRWLVHQTRNGSPDQPLVLLAITDFGLTSAVLGDYDAKTRLKTGGDQAFTDTPAPC